MRSFLEQKLSNYRHQMKDLIVGGDKDQQFPQNSQNNTFS